MRRELQDERKANDDLVQKSYKDKLAMDNLESR
jgi:hypothetical protein